MNVLSLATIFLLMVILLNILIANITFMYQHVLENTKRQFSQLLYLDYIQNSPNNFYSCLSNGSLPLGPVLIIFSPLIVKLRSQRLNDSLNKVIYMIKCFIPFLVCYISVALVSIPFVYLKVLFCILRGKYHNQNNFYIRVTGLARLTHLVSFLLFGPVFLLYSLLVTDMVSLCKKAFKPVQDQSELLFNKDMYKIFKKTLYHFKYSSTISEVGIGEFNDALQKHFDESNIEKSEKSQEQLMIIKQRLQNSTNISDYFDQLDIEYFISMLVYMKNKIYLQDKDDDQMTNTKLRFM